MLVDLMDIFGAINLADLSVVEKVRSKVGVMAAQVVVLMVQT